jgi:hypothetical protein
VHEQTVNIIEGTGDHVGWRYSPITVDTQACAGVDGIMDPDGARCVCQIDGKEYTAFVGGREFDGVISYYFDMFDGEPVPPSESGPIVMPVATINPDFQDGAVIGYSFIVNITEAVGLGSHVIRIYHESADVTFEQPFIDALKDAMGGGDAGDNVVVVPYEDDMSNLRITLGLTAGEVIEYLQAGATLLLDLTESHVYGGLVYFINWVQKQDNGGNIIYRTETPDGCIFYAQGLTEHFSAYFGD